MNKKTLEIERILEAHLPAIQAGQESLDSVLEQHPALAVELRPRLEAALYLRRAGSSLAPRPNYIASSRGWLVTQARRTPRQPAWRRWVDTSPRSLVLEFATLALLVFSLVVVGNNLRLASLLSLPGEPLYPVKRAFEQAQLAFTLNDSRDAQLYIDFSRQRTSEVIELVLVGKYEQVPLTAALLQTQIDRALAEINTVARTDPDQAQALSAAFADSLSNEAFILDVMMNASPPEAIQGLEQALQITEQGLAAVQD
ncbi:MAG: hypothetical protein JW726_09560 [Anaerolineales bacterium]|nr:hypothetical protein [Anaerolineales bacterium]